MPGGMTPTIDVRLAVEDDRAAEDGRVGVEARAPEPLADDGHVAGARLVVVRGEQARPAHRRDAHRAEHAGRRDRAVQPLRLSRRSRLTSALR